MMPPICELCGKDFRGRAQEGGLVRFSDYKPLPRGMVGHPTGLSWFCSRHYRAAEALRSRSRGDALQLLGKKYRLALWLRRILVRLR